jgi:serine/threonine-protein kinase
MGLVFKAFDTVLVRTVALKLIPKLVEDGLTEEKLSDREEARKRLFIEAKAAGRLTHPNIVTIHSYGETDEFEYICMEYVGGKTLFQVIKESKIISIEEAVPIVEQILLALVAANQEHIVHRDIKPSNVIITADNRVKVMDFGIAKLPSLSMTLTGVILGTPFYMSPEQISGQNVDIRSDLFSVGALFYEMVTGERPFQSENTTTMAYQNITTSLTQPQLAATIQNAQEIPSAVIHQNTPPLQAAGGSAEGQKVEKAGNVIIYDKVLAMLTALGLI